MTAHGSVTYRRLPGRGRTPLGSDSLWMGEDHLLLVQLRGFAETYRRFYFRDVQAIILRRTDRAVAAGLLSGILGLVFLGIAAGAGPVWNVIWGVVSGLLLLALAVNVALGPSCSCVLRTALQTVSLRSLGRLRRARFVIERLRLHIDLAQGASAGGEVGAGSGTAAAAGEIAQATGTALPPRPPLVAPQRVTRHDNGRAHEALAYVLLFSAIAVVVPVLYFHVLLSVALSVVFLGRMGCLVAALARQNHSDLPAPLRSFAWTAFGFEVGVMILGMVTAVVIVVKLLDTGDLTHTSTTTPTPLAIMQLMRTNALYRSSAFLSSLVWLALGVRGLLLHRRLASTRGEPWRTLPT